MTAGRNIALCLAAAALAGVYALFAWGQPAGRSSPPAFEGTPAPSPLPELAAPDELLSAQRGTLPILIVAGHGGQVRIPGSSDRTAPGAVLVRDVNTAEMAALLAQRLTDRLGGKPYLVIAHFSRRDADANRAPDEAFENPASARHYHAFHRALRTAVDEIHARFGQGLLLDLHGQARVPDAVVRGTRNGRTVQALITRAGRDALTGPTSVFGALAAKGHRILPEADAPEQGIGRETFFDGGHIVATYGSHTPGGIDAIQVEVGGQRSRTLLTFSRDLAEATATFARAHLANHLPPPATTQTPADPPDDTPAPTPIPAPAPTPLPPR
ncbi:MAG: N-formylglutamate amidohydrolase [Planctomycetaceae bacterium]|jgi:N-formylglutamate amidohydrolase|nr:N-formylglutamate amidohydrolase [Planctomycetaceae bacterium]